MPTCSSVPTIAGGSAALGRRSAGRRAQVLGEELQRGARGSRRERVADDDHERDEQPEPTLVTTTRDEPVARLERADAAHAARNHVDRDEQSRTRHQEADPPRAESAARRPASRGRTPERAAPSRARRPRRRRADAIAASADGRPWLVDRLGGRRASVAMVVIRSPSPRRSATATRHHRSDRVHDQRDDEQRKTGGHERADAEPFDSENSQRDQRGDRVPAVCRMWRAVRVEDRRDDQRDRDRLAERAPEAEHRPADHPALAEREHHVPITPHFVPPSASAPSFSPGGACENTSRMTAVQIGTIISATTSPAMNVEDG